MVLPLVESLQQVVSDLLQALSNRGGTAGRNFAEQFHHFTLSLTSQTASGNRYLPRMIEPHCEPLYLKMFSLIGVIEEVDINSVLVVSGGDDREHRQCPACLQQRRQESAICSIMGITRGIVPESTGVPCSLSRQGL